MENRLTHPYRDQPAAAVIPIKKVNRFFAWLKVLWTGDDGFMYAVITEPSIFRVDENKLCGPFTKRRAWEYAHRFVSANPFSEVQVIKAKKGTTWPPKTNWDE